MVSNIDKYKNDLAKLIQSGDDLLNAIKYECYPKEFKESVKRVLGPKTNIEEYLKELKLPSFKSNYQTWYSEAKTIIKQLLPDRLSDFTKLYEKPNGRKELSHSTYTIEDFLQGVVRRNPMNEIIVDISSAIPRFEQQLNILKSTQNRFSSSLFDIKTLVMADVFDSEIDSARTLLHHKYYRAAGAIAGVVLEKHLSSVSISHTAPLKKKTTTISDLNDHLKDRGIIDVPQWRFIQHLGDIRNLCSHNKQEPTKDQVQDLLDGVAKIIKTVI